MAWQIAACALLMREQEALEDASYLGILWCLSRMESLMWQEGGPSTFCHHLPAYVSGFSCIKGHSLVRLQSGDANETLLLEYE